MDSCMMSTMSTMSTCIICCFVCGGFCTGWCQTPEGSLVDSRLIEYVMKLGSNPSNEGFSENYIVGCSDGGSDGIVVLEEGGAVCDQSVRGSVLGSEKTLSCVS